MTISLLGIIGGALFGFAAVPQAIATLKARKGLGTFLSIILSVLGGTLFMYAYLTARNGFDPLLTVIYAVSWATVLYFARR